MPEEKKEKFTFSDKIKSSKSSGNKSFAKSSSKIGRDGKPKQTLFERTRRDAPFFIAALVALLLLPFLYKYSGQPSEESAFAPTSEESMFDPERYGFDTAMIEDPDGQIAQLSGRDSLSLIKGWGANQEADYGRDDMDFDASIGTDYDAEGRYAKAHQESSNIDVEENTTNIYKRRAKAGTRAAFRRAATKIGALSPAAMRRPGGGGLGVKNFGGGMKNAAQKVKPSAPAEGPKPVSLQPLRAKSGRAAFGGTGTAGRKSRDAMGKADAVAALRDANVKPVDPTRVGGLDMFSMGPGGGAGKLGHTINIGNGKEPWWWDMMKTRMQKEWEKNFERKWGWITFWDDLAKDILKRLISPVGSFLSCLAWGTDDGDMGHVFGYGAGGGDDPTCCGYTAGKLAPVYGEDRVKDLKAFCTSAMRKKIQQDLGVESCEEYKGGTPAGASASAWLARKQCWGFKARAAATIKEGSSGLSCLNIDDHQYSLQVADLPRKWQKHTYIYVVARNYRSASMPGLSVDAPRGMLCSENDPFSIGAKSSAGGGSVTLPELREMGEELNNNAKIVRESVSNSKEQEFTANIYERNPESIANGCVIYVQKGNVFNYKNFKEKTIQAFTKVVKEGGFDKGSSRSASTIAADAFDQLDLMFIEGFASKNKLAYAQWGETGNNLHEILPMVYWRFHDAFVDHKKSTNKADGSRTNVDNRKFRKWGEDSAKAPRCYFQDSLSISCIDDPQRPQATVTFKQGYKGGQAIDPVQEAQNGLRVTATFKPLNGDAGAELNMHQPGNAAITPKGQSVTYTLNVSSIKDAAGKKMDPTNTIQVEGRNVGEYVGNIIWKVYRNASTQNEAHRDVDSNSTLTATCTLNLSGEPINNYIEIEKCTPGAVEKLPAQKVAGQCQKQRTCSNDGAWGDWVNVPGDMDCEHNPVPGQEQVVHFYDLITKVPCNTDAVNGTRRVSDATGCLTWETCKLTQGRALLLPLDDDTKGYLTRAQNKFNQANAGRKIKLEYNVDSLSVANLIDAIMINPDDGTVPANTVCLLGKTIGSNAKDPQAPAFDNLFGAFLAFIGYDSASFPSQKTFDCDGNRVTDKRFLCRSDYYWGGYVNSKERINYERQVDAGPWHGFPLKALARTAFPKTGDRMTLTDRENRIRFHSEKPDGYADLLRRAPCQYDSNQKVPLEDVIEYINRLCQYGDQIKPKATKKYDCSRRYSDGAYHQERVDCDTVDCFH